MFVIFQGNSHVVYNSSFYYHRRNSSNIVKYDLLTNTHTQKHLPLLGYEDNIFLYTESVDYVDLSADENGLWAIYGLPQSNNNTVVAKIDPHTLTVSDCHFAKICHWNDKWEIVEGIKYKNRFKWTEPFEAILTKVFYFWLVRKCTVYIDILT